MIKKIVLAVAVAAVATAFASTASFAKKAPKPCTPGSLETGKANEWKWAPVSICGLDGKWYPTLTSCYVPSGLCPK